MLRSSRASLSACLLLLVFLVFSLCSFRGVSGATVTKACNGPAMNGRANSVVFENSDVSKDLEIEGASGTSISDCYCLLRNLDNVHQIRFRGTITSSTIIIDSNTLVYPGGTANSNMIFFEKVVRRSKFYISNNTATLTHTTDAGSVLPAFIKHEVGSGTSAEEMYVYEVYNNRFDVINKKNSDACKTMFWTTQGTWQKHLSLVLNFTGNFMNVTTSATNSQVRVYFAMPGGVNGDTFRNLKTFLLQDNTYIVSASSDGTTALTGGVRVRLFTSNPSALDNIKNLHVIGNTMRTAVTSQSFASIWMVNMLSGTTFETIHINNTVYEFDTSAKDDNAPAASGIPGTGILQTYGAITQCRSFIVHNLTMRGSSSHSKANTAHRVRGVYFGNSVSGTVAAPLGIFFSDIALDQVSVVSTGASTFFNVFEAEKTFTGTNTASITFQNVAATNFSVAATGGGKSDLTAFSFESGLNDLDSVKFINVTWDAHSVSFDTSAAQGEQNFMIAHIGNSIANIKEGVVCDGCVVRARRLDAAGSVVSPSARVIEALKNLPNGIVDNLQGEGLVFRNCEIDIEAFVPASSSLNIEASLTAMQRLTDISQVVFANNSISVRATEPLFNNFWIDGMFVKSSTTLSVKSVRRFTSDGFRFVVTAKKFKYFDCGLFDFQGLVDIVDAMEINNTEVLELSAVHHRPVQRDTKFDFQILRFNRGVKNIGNISVSGVIYHHVDVDVDENAALYTLQFKEPVFTIGSNISSITVRDVGTTTHPSLGSTTSSGVGVPSKLSFRSLYGKVTVVAGMRADTAVNGVGSFVFENISFGFDPLVTPSLSLENLSSSTNNNNNNSGGGVDVEALADSVEMSVVRFPDSSSLQNAGAYGGFVMNGARIGIRNISSPLMQIFLVLVQRVDYGFTGGFWFSDMHIAIGCASQPIGTTSGQLVAHLGYFMNSIQDFSQGITLTQYSIRIGRAHLPATLSTNNAAAIYALRFDNVVDLTGAKPGVEVKGDDGNKFEFGEIDVPSGAKIDLTVLRFLGNVKGLAIGSSIVVENLEWTAKRISAAANLVSIHVVEFLARYVNCRNQLILRNITVDVVVANTKKSVGVYALRFSSSDASPIPVSNTGRIQLRSVKLRASVEQRTDGADGDLVVVNLLRFVGPADLIRPRTAMMKSAIVIDGECEAMLRNSRVMVFSVALLHAQSTLDRIGGTTGIVLRSSAVIDGKPSGNNKVIVDNVSTTAASGTSGAVAVRTDGTLDGKKKASLNVLDTTVRVVNASSIAGNLNVHLLLLVGAVQNLPRINVTGSGIELDGNITLDEETGGAGVLSVCVAYFASTVTNVPTLFFKNNFIQSASSDDQAAATSSSSSSSLSISASACYIHGLSFAQSITALSTNSIYVEGLSLVIAGSISTSSNAAHLYGVRYEESVEDLTEPFVLHGISLSAHGNIQSSASSVLVAAVYFRSSIRNMTHSDAGGVSIDGISVHIGGTVSSASTTSPIVGGVLFLSTGIAIQQVSSFHISNVFFNVSGMHSVDAQSLLYVAGLCSGVVKELTSSLSVTNVDATVGSIEGDTKPASIFGFAFTQAVSNIAGGIDFRNVTLRVIGSMRSGSYLHIIPLYFYRDVSDLKQLHVADTHVLLERGSVIRSASGGAVFYIVHSTSGFVMSNIGSILLNNTSIVLRSNDVVIAPGAGLVIHLFMVRTAIRDVVSVRIENARLASEGADNVLVGLHAQASLVFTTSSIINVSTYALSHSAIELRNVTTTNGTAAAPGVNVAAVRVMCAPSECEMRDVETLIVENISTTLHSVASPQSDVRCFGAMSASLHNITNIGAIKIRDIVVDVQSAQAQAFVLGYGLVLNLLSTAAANHLPVFRNMDVDGIHFKRFAANSTESSVVVSGVRLQGVASLTHLVDAESISVSRVIIENATLGSGGDSSTTTVALLVLAISVDIDNISSIVVKNSAVRKPRIVAYYPPSSAAAAQPTAERRFSVSIAQFSGNISGLRSALICDNNEIAVMARDDDADGGALLQQQQQNDEPLVVAFKAGIFRIPSFITGSRMVLGPGAEKSAVQVLVKNSRITCDESVPMLRSSSNSSLWLLNNNKPLTIASGVAAGSPKSSQVVDFILENSTVELPRNYSGAAALIRITADPLHVTVPVEFVRAPRVELLNSRLTHFHRSSSGTGSPAPDQQHQVMVCSAARCQLVQCRVDSTDTASSSSPSWHVYQNFSIVNNSVSYAIAATLLGLAWATTDVAATPHAILSNSARFFIYNNALSRHGAILAFYTEESKNSIDGQQRVQVLPSAANHALVRAAMSLNGSTWYFACPNFWPFHFQRVFRRDYEPTSIGGVGGGKVTWEHCHDVYVRQTRTASESRESMTAGSGTLSPPTPSVSPETPTISSTVKRIYTDSRTPSSGGGGYTASSQTVSLDETRSDGFGTKTRSAQGQTTSESLAESRSVVDLRQSHTRSDDSLVMTATHSRSPTPSAAAPPPPSDPPLVQAVAASPEAEAAGGATATVGSAMGSATALRSLSILSLGTRMCEPGQDESRARPPPALFFPQSVLPSFWIGAPADSAQRINNNNGSTNSMSIQEILNNETELAKMSLQDRRNFVIIHRTLPQHLGAVVMNTFIFPICFTAFLMLCFTVLHIVWKKSLHPFAVAKRAAVIGRFMQVLAFTSEGIWASSLYLLLEPRAEPRHRAAGAICFIVAVACFTAAAWLVHRRFTRHKMEFVHAMMQKKVKGEMLDPEKVTGFWKFVLGEGVWQVTVSDSTLEKRQAREAEEQRQRQQQQQQQQQGDFSIPLLELGDDDGDGAATSRDGNAATSSAPTCSSTKKKNSAGSFSWSGLTDMLNPLTRKFGVLPVPEREQSSFHRARRIIVPYWFFLDQVLITMAMGIIRGGSLSNPCSWPSWTITALIIALLSLLLLFSFRPFSSNARYFFECVGSLLVFIACLYLVSDRNLGKRFEGLLISGTTLAGGGLALCSILTMVKEKCMHHTLVPAREVERQTVLVDLMQNLRLLDDNNHNTGGGGNNSNDVDDNFAAGIMAFLSGATAEDTTTGSNNNNIPDDEIVEIDLSIDLGGDDVNNAEADADIELADGEGGGAGTVWDYMDTAADSGPADEDLCDPTTEEEEMQNDDEAEEEEEHLDDETRQLRARGSAMNRLAQDPQYVDGKQHTSRLLDQLEMEVDDAALRERRERAEAEARKAGRAAVTDSKQLQNIMKSMKSL